MKDHFFFWIFGKIWVKILAYCGGKIQSRFYPGDLVTHTESWHKCNFLYYNVPGLFFFPSPLELQTWLHDSIDITAPSFLNSIFQSKKKFFRPSSHFEILQRCFHSRNGTLTKTPFCLNWDLLVWVTSLTPHLRKLKSRRKMELFLLPVKRLFVSFRNINQFHLASISPENSLSGFFRWDLLTINIKWVIFTIVNK